MNFPLLIACARPYWRSYYPNTDAIIYVVDSDDKSRIGISKKELMMMLEEEELKGVPIMIFANKQVPTNTSFVPTLKPSFPRTLLMQCQSKRLLIN